MRRFLALAMTAGLAAAAGADTLVVLNKSDATASLIDLAKGAAVATLPTGQAPHEVDVSPDGKRALVANYGTREAPGSTLTVIDVPGARVVGTIDLAPHQRPHGVEWIDGRRGRRRSTRPSSGRCAAGCAGPPPPSPPRPARRRRPCSGA